MDVSRTFQRVTVLVMMFSLLLFSGCGFFGLGSNELGEASVSPGHSLAGVEFEGVQVWSITQQRMEDMMVPVSKVRADFPFSIVTPRMNDLYPNRIDAVVVDGENMSTLYEESFDVQPNPDRVSIKDRMILYTLIDAASYVASCQANQMQTDTQIGLEGLLPLTEGGLPTQRASQCQVNMRLILRFWYPDARNSVFYQDVIIPSAIFWVNGIIQVRPLGLGGTAYGGASFIDGPPPSDADLFAD